jgi:hypothetical protein
MKLPGPSGRSLLKKNPIDTRIKKINNKQALKIMTENISQKIKM